MCTKAQQIAAAIQRRDACCEPRGALRVGHRVAPPPTGPSGVIVEQVGNLLSHESRAAAGRHSPEPIVGYIATSGRGVSIHRDGVRASLLRLERGVSPSA